MGPARLRATTGMIPTPAEPADGTRQQVSSCFRLTRRCRQVNFARSGNPGLCLPSQVFMVLVYMGGAVARRQYDSTWDATDWIALVVRIFAHLARSGSRHARSVLLKVHHLVPSHAAGPSRQSPHDRDSRMSTHKKNVQILGYESAASRDR
jgi:hypothetical protein